MAFDKPVVDSDILKLHRVQNKETVLYIRQSSSSLQGEAENTVAFGSLKHIVWHYSHDAGW